VGVSSAMPGRSDRDRDQERYYAHAAFPGLKSPASDAAIDGAFYEAANLLK
jgi:hypothetical protein